MTDVSNEKAQFLLAAARILKWKHTAAVWGATGMNFNFRTEQGTFVIPIDTELPGWADLSPTEKLGAAQSAIKAGAALAPAFDPTGPKWVDFTGPAA